MKCPVCGCSDNSRVVDSRRNGAWLRRRRECAQCGTRWSTQEIPDTELARLLEIRELAEKLRGVLG